MLMHDNYGNELFEYTYIIEEDDNRRLVLKNIGTGEETVTEYRNIQQAVKDGWKIVRRNLSLSYMAVETSHILNVNK